MGDLFDVNALKYEGSICAEVKIGREVEKICSGRRTQDECIERRETVVEEHTYCIASYSGYQDVMQSMLERNIREMATNMGGSILTMNFQSVPDRNRQQEVAVVQKSSPFTIPNFRR